MGKQQEVLLIQRRQVRFLRALENRLVAGVSLNTSFALSPHRVTLRPPPSYCTWNLPGPPTGQYSSHHVKCSSMLILHSAQDYKLEEPKLPWEDHAARYALCCLRIALRPFLDPPARSDTVSRRHVFEPCTSRPVLDSVSVVVVVEVTISLGRSGQRFPVGRVSCS